MRNISQAGLAKLASRYGNEPITIIEVDWVDGSTAVYADRTIGDIPGRIVEVGDLDNAVNVNGNGSDGQSTGGSTASQELAITLDDTDGSVKAIFDRQDVHKRPARVYQYFSGLDLADKFLLFSGKINTPVSWSERDRTVKFTILSQLEDLEIGFSAEEGQFPYLPSDLVGKTWPMVFGTAVNYQALQINKAVKGTTLAGVGVLSGMDLWSALPDGADDGQFKLSLLMMLIQINHLKKVKECWAPSFHPPVDAKKAASLQKQIDSLQSQVNQAVAKQAQQVACTLARRNLQINDANANGLGANPVRILGGEDFPQNQTITINVNDALFTGHFEADLFYIDSRVHPTDDATAAAAAASKTTEPAVCLTPTQVSYYRYEDEVPNGCGDGFPAGNKILDMGVTITNSNATVSEMDTTPIVQQFWADAGTEVTLAIDAPITYIASIVPGTVLAVRAYKQLIGQRRLVDVPTNLYTIKTQTYGSVTAVEIVVQFPLSARKDEGWTDDLYITFQSDIGPDVVEILKHLITHYTNLGWDEESFNHAQEKLQAFPANFPLWSRRTPSSCCRRSPSRPAARFGSATARSI